MKIDTLDQRTAREREIQTNRLVVETFTRIRDQAQAHIDRLSREIAVLEGIETCICTFADRRICPQHGKAAS